MAVGRMLNRHISLDRAVNELSSDTCRLAFTWTIPHLDRDGRICGDPAALRSLVFPRREDISTKQMQSYIIEWKKAGLVEWYESGKDLCLEFKGFRKNQPNLRYDREAASIYPDPAAGTTPDLLRSESGPDSGPPPPNGSEEKRKEVNNNRAVAPSSERAVTTRPIYHLFEQAFVGKNQEFDFKREGRAIKRLEEYALARDSPEEFAKMLLVVFWQLTHGEDKFWREQPFLPSVLSSGGIYPRVLKAAENMRADSLTEEQAGIIQEVFR